MSTTYPGDPAATEAPSVPPTPGVVPSVVIPADGEALNAASITQALKALADFAAWQMSPRAKASDWAVPIQLWRTGGLKQAFGIDHLGYPFGRLNHWRQNWESNLWTVTGNNPVASYPASGVTDSGWKFSSFKNAGGAGQVTIQDPSAQFPGSRFVRIQAADSAGDYSAVVRTAPCRFNANVLLAMEWEAKPFAAANYAWAMGFNGLSTFIAGGHGPIAQFYNLAGSGNWRCHTDDGTTLTNADSGVAFSAVNTIRFRIEYHGASVDEAGTERVLFFINGALVANVTATMPSVPATPLASPMFALLNTGGTGGTLDLGIAQGCNNLWTDAF
jgi:hypothetical protein